jgi:uncharacterized protein (TIGR01777 family)
VKITVTGATGNIGSALVRELRERGDEVTALSRDADRASAALGVPAATWPDPKGEPPPLDALRGRDGVVHLLGEQIAQRWTDEAKREIRDSRVLSTRNLVNAIGELPEGERPRVLVSQSGVDVYADRGDEQLDEDAPRAGDFLAGVVADWEAEAERARDYGLRVVPTRTGVVLSEKGGALGKMLPFFKLGVGGPVAGGRQYTPWVHIDDVVGAIIFCLETEAITGPVNLTAPEPVTNKEFSGTLGRVLRRPAFAPVPAFALRALYGEMGSIVITGQRAVPRRLEELGYRFRRPDLEPALRSVIHG